MQLYPFQEVGVANCVRRIPDGGRLLVVSPTGTGKSVVLAHLAAVHASLGRSVGVCVHRYECLSQVAEKLRACGLRFGIMAPGHTPEPHEHVQLCMVQTLRRRMKETPWDVVICDEAHRDEFGVVVRSSPRWLYGFTATPWRDDGRLGDWYGCNMLELIRYSEAIAQHYIVPARVYAPDVPDLSGVDVAGADYDVAQVAETLSKLGVIGNAVDTWLAKARGEKTVVFCANVAHAEETTAAFQGRGIQAACVTGETPEAERRISMARFRVGTITVLVNVAVFTEGLDVADASVIVLLRPTHSRSLYMQIAGRGGRASPGKTHYRLFDHTGSCFEHGSPTQDHQWVLEPKSTRKRASDGPAVTFRRCEKCFFVFAPGDTQCPNCAAPNTTRPVKHKNGTLVEVDLEAYKPLTGFIDAFNKARRKAFAEASAMGIKGPRAFGMVNAALKETKAVLRGQHQIVVPKNTDLLW